MFGALCSKGLHLQDKGSERGHLEKRRHAHLLEFKATAPSSIGSTLGVADLCSPEDALGFHINGDSESSGVFSSSLLSFWLLLKVKQLD